MISLKDRIEIHKNGFTIKQIIELVDSKIQSLNKKDLRNLYVIIRTDYATTKLWIESSKEYYNTYNMTSKRRFDNAIIAHSLYDKAGVDDLFRQFHWEHYRAEQIRLHHNMNSMTKPIRQDNKTYINYGTDGSNVNKIRYPRKCRKTAWKHFYRLFPHLNPENITL